MFDPRQIRISDYTYELPDDRIARYPLPNRDSSKLLLYNNQGITDSIFSNLASFIQKGSLLVSNNSKVIPARIFFRKASGASIEVFCLEPVLPADYQESFASTSSCTWKCIVGNLKKWKNGKLHISLLHNNQDVTLHAEIIHRELTEQHIRFEWDNPLIDFATIIELAGTLPIPPYLERETEDIDLQHYQTIYSKIKGSVAAPTAGLHFTSNVFQQLREKYCQLAELTLHVGAGTFKPVKAETLGGHSMHCEHFSISKLTIELLLEHLENITAVGTTTARTLESLYQVGVQLCDEQMYKSNSFSVDHWHPYHSSSSISCEQALTNIYNYLKHTGNDKLQCSTSILIVPGYNFKVVNRLITNFHQPRSTLILLVAAFVGESWKSIYNHALSNNYRFLSYGDSSLLDRFE